MSHPVYALNLFNISSKEVKADDGRVVALSKFREAVAGDN